MARYFWQSSSWPQFHWDISSLLMPLGNARQAQGELLSKAEYIELQSETVVLTEEAVTTSAIEGEKLSREAVRSSVARRLGLPTAGLPVSDRRIDGLVEMLVDATKNYASPLDQERLKGWHSALFPSGYSGIRKIETGRFRQGKEPMQVVSGPVGREKIHFEAPGVERLPEELNRFIKWFNSPPKGLDGLLRAAIAHLWFVTIHPFDDGNGRISRAISDMALAQDEKKSVRLYSMSTQILVERKGYYSVLEKTQRGNGEITHWLIWFLECLEKAMKKSNAEIQLSLDLAQFWKRISHVGLNDRQRKVINRLLKAEPGEFSGGLTNEKYRKIAKTNREAAKRDIGALLAKGILAKNPQRGRSTNYRLVWK